MHFLTKGKNEVRLRLLETQEIPGDEGPEFLVSGTPRGVRFSELVTAATHAAFEMVPASSAMRLGARAAQPTARRGPAPAVFEDEESGRIRMAYKEIVIRFRRGTKALTRDRLLKKYGFKIRARNRFVRSQFIVFHPRWKYVGAELLDVANDWATTDEVTFAVPNFVSQFDREALPSIHPEEWHLRNRGRVQGQKVGEDVSARDAWKITTGRPRVVVAVLDDGVDTEHPNLKSRILRNPDPNEPRDTRGRDFFISDYDDPDHFNPRPKLFRRPFHRMRGNDIHGTPCAGVIAASGDLDNVSGIAPRCRILPVKIFHADDLATDSQVADAIQYAARFADVLSCSWSAAYSPAIELAIEDAGQARDGRGAAVFCATGNDNGRRVSFPARLPESVAIGASTDQGKLAAYSNVGPEVSVVAPSSGGVRGIYSTDVSYPGRGFNTGRVNAGGADGHHTNDFGGTSSATPLVAGIAALALSVKPELDRDGLQELIEKTADKIGRGYDGNGHSPRFGHGRVNAANAVATALTL